MEESLRKEQFSKAFVSAIAARAGVNVGGYQVDDDSIDIKFGYKNHTGNGLRDPEIGVQLKCSSQSIVGETSLTYPLKIKNYNDLRDTNVLIPRYLFVLIVPSEQNQWLSCNNNELVLRNTCYWATLKDRPATTNTTSVSVGIPVDQKVDDKTLLSLLMDAAAL